MKITFIDNCCHGYYSISKSDFLKVLEPKDISSYSGMTFSRIYLEEDDASKFFNALKNKGFSCEIKNSYNPSFPFHHNYKAELFYYVPKKGDIIDNKYEVIEFKKTRHILIKRIVDNRIFQIPASNPFNYINTVKESFKNIL